MEVPDANLLKAKKANLWDPWRIFLSATQKHYLQATTHPTPPTTHFAVPFQSADTTVARWKLYNITLEKKNQFNKDLQDMLHADIIPLCVILYIAYNYSAKRELCVKI